jgi:hypothetical protein
VGGDVPVAEAEPVWPGAVGGELGQHGEGLLIPAPPLLLADAAAERVHDGVEVRADVQPEQADVIARIADDGDLGQRRGGLQAAQEARGTHAAGQHGYPHEGKSRRPEPRL